MLSILKPLKLDLAHLLFVTLLDVRTTRDFGSEYHLVVGEIRLKVAFIKSTQSK